MQQGTKTGLFFEKNEINCAPVRIVFLAGARCFLGRSVAMP